MNFDDDLNGRPPKLKIKYIKDNLNEDKMKDYYIVIWYQWRMTSIKDDINT